MLIKSIFDFFATLIIIIVFLPLMLLIALLTVLDSGFPIIHRRVVHSSPSTCFSFLKFRTMHVDADKMLEQMLNNKAYREEYDKYSKFKNDPRITKFGKFLRKTSMDELPQLFNVLFFQMSLVGPRPKTSYELKKYYSKENTELIFLVKPGITGIQQISGRANLPYTERIKMEIGYIKKRNFWYDLIILFKTPFALFKGGVY